MPDGDVLVLKQLIAVVDGRTTIVCLHAAGQIQQVNASFDTLAGEYPTPPFHVHCRSFVKPWLPGMVNVQRKLANVELQRRPMAHRRIGPGGEVGAPIPPPPPAGPASPLLPPPGPPLPSPLPAANTPLLNVPDEQLEQFIRANPKRFTFGEAGGGVNESIWVEEYPTGLRYLLKRGQKNAESVSEIMGARIGNHLGLPGQVRWAGPVEDGNGWVLVEHVEDLVPGYRVNAGFSIDDLPKLVNILEDKDEPLRVLLQQYAIDETDAHAGNMLIMGARGGGKLRVVPIDRSRSLLGYIDPLRLPGFGVDPLEMTTLRKWMLNRPNPASTYDTVREVTAQRGAGLRTIRAYDDAVARLKTIDWDELTRGLPEMFTADRVRLVKARIDALERNRVANLRHLGVPG